MFWRHPVLGFTTLAYLAFVGFVTLSPTPYGETSKNVLDRMLEIFSNHSSTQWLTFSTVEQIANVALFIPVGTFFLLVFSRSYWWLAILGGAAASTLIEWLQGHFLPTRVADPIDIVMNTGGTIIGVLLGLLLTASTEHYHRKVVDQEALIARQRQELEALRSKSSSSTTPPPSGNGSSSRPQR